ncbi:MULTISPECIES: DUF3363 domain-containing protein [unclassified Bradyrhizobium]|uniref:DUF3363 domain-containing protein n=1 Tax=unclassified Bradyrhizobium TaxID=2631580 RepID=UPI001FF71B81|nr:MULTISPECIES: DUF3363 domain-containing protein [unclassified Bradyrhizobium]MCK1587731.1 DUF3363 domain-containing protein [Bradyrhizobium sp. 169]
MANQSLAVSSGAGLMKGTAFAVVDGIDGRVHHVKLPAVEAAGDAPIGGIVELRRFADTRGRTRIALAVRSELFLDQQVAADGATWLDRQLVARDPAELSRIAFGAEVRAHLNGASMFWPTKDPPGAMATRSG